MNAKPKMNATNVTSLLLFASLAGCGSNPSISDSGPFPNGYRELARDYLKTTLFDPYSARDFQIAAPKPGQLLITGTFNHQPGWLVCYRGNAKNRMGAYAGIKTGVILISGNRAVASNEDPEHYIIRTTCSDVAFESISLN